MILDAVGQNPELLEELGEIAKILLLREEARKRIRAAVEERRESQSQEPPTQ